VQDGRITRVTVKIVKLALSENGEEIGMTLDAQSARLIMVENARPLALITGGGGASARRLRERREHLAGTWRSMHTARARSTRCSRQSWKHWA